MFFVAHHDTPTIFQNYIQRFLPPTNEKNEPNTTTISEHSHKTIESCFTIVLLFHVFCPGMLIWVSYAQIKKLRTDYYAQMKKVAYR